MTFLYDPAHVCKANRKYANSTSRSYILSLMHMHQELPSWFPHAATFYKGVARLRQLLTCRSSCFVWQISLCQVVTMHHEIAYIIRSCL